MPAPRTHKRPHRDPQDRQYHIGGKKYEHLIGTRKQVFHHESAYKTAGGLIKDDLVKNKSGEIVSKAKSTFEKGFNRLEKHGITACKGKFGAVMIPKNKTAKAACAKPIFIKKGWKASATSNNVAHTYNLRSRK